MRGLLDKIKHMVVYDADREFYAQMFPDSVSRADLMWIRTMTHTDLPAVMAIEIKNYPFPWQEDIFIDCFRAGYDCWVCEESGRIIGYCLVAVAVGEAHILNVSVDPAEQKQGIGRKLMNHIIDSVQGRVEMVFLEVRPSNLGAISLYQSMGFNEIGIRKDYYPAEDGREDAIMLALQVLS